MMHPALLELLLKERQRDLEKRARAYATHRRGVVGRHRAPRRQARLGPGQESGAER